MRLPRPTARHAPLLLLIAMLCFGTMAFLSKLATRHYDGPTVACFRFGIGVLVGLLLVLRRGRGLRPHRLDLLVTRGVLGGGAVLMYFLAIEHLGVGLATLLNCASPLFVVIVERFFLDERLSARTFAALLLGALGVALVVVGLPTGGQTFSGAGVWIAVGATSALLSAGAMTTVRAMRRGSQPESALDIFVVFCVVGLVVCAPLARTWHWPAPVDVPVLLGVGLAATAGQLLMNAVLSFVSATVYGIATQLIVVISAVLGALLLDEPWTLLSALGAVVTMAAAVVATARYAERTAEAPGRAT